MIGALVSMLASVPKNACVLIPANSTFGGSFSGNCNWVAGYFANPLDPYILYLTGGPIVLLLGILGMRIYFEGPVGRRIWHNKSLFGIGRIAGGFGLFGTMEPLTERLYWFDATYRTGILGLARKGFKTIIQGMPGSIVQLSQRDGGVSFALVDLDRGVALNPDVEAWAEAAFADFAETHDSQAFVFNWKLREIEETATFERFPDPLTVDLDGQTEVNVPMGNQMVTMTLYQLVNDPNALAWWGHYRSEESKRINEDRQLKVLIEAMLAGADHYTLGDGKDAKNFEITPRMPSDFEQQFWGELANSKGEYAKAIVGGRVISTQYVAGIMKGLPWPAHIIAYYEKIKAEVAAEMKGQYAQYVPMIIGVGFATLLVLVGLAAVGVIR